jgi:hypothetical protein
LPENLNANMPPGNNEVSMIASGESTEMEEAAQRSELAAKYRNDGVQEAPSSSSSRKGNAGSKGTILEAAFVDPAYAWPPADGQGKNAIELQASMKLMKDDDSVFTTDSAKERMRSPRKPSNYYKKKGIFGCCRSGDAAVNSDEMRAYEEQKILAREAKQQHLLAKQEHYKNKERAARRASKYTTAPEGILIYRLDTGTNRLELVSQPHANTDLETVVQDCTVMAAAPGPDKSRRALEITDEHGVTHVLTACEQRTATAWLEAMHLMHAKTGRRGLGGLFRRVSIVHLRV